MEGLGKVALDVGVAVAAGVGVSVVGVLWANLKWITEAKKMMRSILSTAEENAGNVALLYRLQGPMLDGMKASLEAQRDGKCDGNVKNALLRIQEAKDSFDAHLIGKVEGVNDQTDRKAA